MESTSTLFSPLRNKATETFSRYLENLPCAETPRQNDILADGSPLLAANQLERCGGWVNKRMISQDNPRSNAFAAAPKPQYRMARRQEFETCKEATCTWYCRRARSLLGNDFGAVGLTRLPIGCL